nr:FN3 associated domain-containing protein [uncultured Schaedlerella sp.]
MIKDRVFQKRIKGKVLAMAMTAVMTSLFVPLTADAADAALTWGQTQDLAALNKGNLVLEEGGWKIEGGGLTGKCGEECTGHKVTGTTKSGYGIVVKSGKHRILMENATIDASNGSGENKVSALNLDSGANADVDLYLSGDNQLISPNGKAGIYAPGNTSLTIKSLSGDDKKDTLVAKAGSGGAGIGGEGYVGTGANAGSITIDGGTITAMGGNLGTGIGGCDQGTAKITINGGYVTAKGGDGVPNTVAKNTKGAPGIGGAGNSSIVINNGNVIAIGGQDDGDTKRKHAPGFSGTNLTSLNGGKTVIKSDGFSEGLQTNSLNGLVWNINRDANGIIVDDQKPPQPIDMTAISTLKDLGGKIVHGNTCDVYGKAVMPADFPKDFKEGNILNIREYASFLIPVDGPMLINNGTIMGKGTLINPQMVKHENGSFDTDNLTLRLSFNPDKDITINQDLMYTGETLDKDVFEQKNYRNEGGIEYRIDDTGMTYKFEKTDDQNYEIDKYGVKNAGEYSIIFNYGGSDYKKPFTVKQRPLSDKDVKVEPLPSIDYKGEVIDATAFTSKDVVVTYRGEPLRTPQDYTWATKDDPKNAGTATLIITSGSSNGNFSGNREELFEIKKVSIEKAEFTLKGESNDIYYDGNKHQLAVDSVTLMVDNKDLAPKEGTDFDVKYSTSDFISAGEITVQLVTEKSKNFTGTCEKKYTIHPRQLTVQKITAESRPYDGTGKVKISNVEVDISKDGKDNSNATGFEGILPGDFDKIGPPEKITGYITTKDQEGNYPPANVGNYSTVVLEEDMCLSGEKGKCYTLKGTYDIANLKDAPTQDDPDAKTGPWALTEEVVITKGKAPTVKLSAVPEEENGKFKASLQINPATELDFIDPKSVMHYYYAPEGTAEPAKDADGWKFGTIGDILCSDEDFLPKSKWRFWAYLEGTGNVDESNIDSCLVEFPKLTQLEKPASCTLDAIPDGDTFTLVVRPEQVPTEDRPNGLYLYSFDPEGKPETYTYSGRMEGAEPNTEYTAWIKYAESDMYTEGVDGVSATIKTGALDVMQPEISSNGTVVKDEGEISFKGSTDVSINYPGKLKMRLFYTTDGSAPTASSTEYTDQTFAVDKDTTVKAIALKEGVATSKVTTANMKKTGEADNNPGGNQPGGTEDIIPVVKKLDDATIQNSPLGSTEFNNMDAVTQQMASKILLKKGYSNSQMIYCDLTVQIRRENGQYTDATEEDFAKAGSKGIRVGLAFEGLRAFGLPADVNGEKYNFAVSHMFSTDIPRLSVTAGQTEEPAVSKTADGKGIAFNVTGTSPLAIAWADIANSDPNPVEDPDDPTNPDDPDDPNNPTDPDDPTNPDDPNNPTNPDDPNNTSGDGNQNGSDGTTSQTDAAQQGVSDDSKNALSNIMPKTGDPLSFVPWIAAAVISIGVITGIMKKKSGKKNTDKKKKTTTTAKKTTKKKK